MRVMKSWLSSACSVWIITDLSVCKMKQYIENQNVILCISFYLSYNYLYTMSTIKTVGELKEVLASLPDTMPGIGYDGSGKACIVSWWVSELNRNYIDNNLDTNDGDDVNTLTISTD